MAYPNTFIRGISVREYLLEDGTVSASAFDFSQKTREDGWKSFSINWEDDENAGRFTLGQRKENGDIQFKAGYVVIPREEIDHLNHQPTVNGMLNYERQPLVDNPFHGNILARGNVPLPTLRRIQAGLTLIVSKIVHRD